jgi:hypothetical protein
MDSVFMKLYDVSGGKSIKPSYVRENLDVRLDKYEKVGKYRVLSRFDSVGRLVVKKYTKPWFVSKNRGCLLPFQMFPINQTFWFLHAWEKDKPDIPITIGGYKVPAPERIPSPMNRLLIQDSSSKYYFLFDGYSRKRDTFCNCVLRIFYIDSYFPLDSYTSIIILDAKMNPVAYIMQSFNSNDAHLVTIQKDGFYDARLGLTWKSLKDYPLSELAILIKKIPKPTPDWKVHEKELFKMEFSDWGQRLRNDYDWENRKMKK